jgi:hypothetical protein
MSTQNVVVGAAAHAPERAHAAYFATVTSVVSMQ